MLVRVNLKTNFLKDTFVFCVRDEHKSGQWLLDQIKERYDEWHTFNVYDFVFDVADFDADEVSKSLVDLFEVENFRKAKEIVVDVVESPESIARREEEIRKMEEEMLRRQEEARIREENRRKRIRQLKRIGECWELDGYSNFIDVPLEDDGKVVRNKGSLDQWCCIRYLHLIPESYEQFYFSVVIEDLPQTTNTWRVCIGVVPVQFRPEADRHWIGAQHSWSYIAGTGGKCYNSGKSMSFGAQYGAGDVVGVLVNFPERTLEFFKNGVSQGIAFRNIRGPVYPAVSMTAKNCRVRLLTGNFPSQVEAVMHKNSATELAKRNRWMDITSPAFQDAQIAAWKDHRENAWSPIFSYARDEAMFYPGGGHLITSVTNQGSDDKWRVARTVGSYGGEGVQGFEVFIVNDTKSSNTWRICVGIVPLHFSSTKERIWVGSQNSYCYIGGTGGKCHNCGQSTAYGERFTAGDRVAVVLDFDNHTVEFFKNDESQGIAFEGVNGSFYGAISLTADGGLVQLNSLSDEKISSLVEQGESHRKKVHDVATKFGNVWELSRCSPTIMLERENLMAVSAHSNGDWLTAASFAAYQSGRRYFEIELGQQSNSNEKTKFCVGVVSKKFDSKHTKSFVGAYHSWGYVSDGSKYANLTNSKYASRYGVGDRIGVLMDFDNRILEFFKNGMPQGEAFNDLYGPVFAAVSMIGAGSTAQIDGKIEDEKMNELFLFR